MHVYHDVAIFLLCLGGSKGQGVATVFAIK